MIDPASPSPKSQSIAQRITRSLDDAWNYLITPGVTIQGREHRQQARLLSSLLLALILAIMLTVIIRAIGGVVWQDFAALASVGAMAIFIGIYRLSRTHHYTVSASLTVVALFAVIHTAPLWADRVDQVLFYASLPILLSSMLFSLPIMLGVAGVSIGSLLLLALNSLGGTDFYIAPLSQTLIITTIIVIFIHHRDLLESERQAALRASENNYRLLLEQASDGIFITDPQGNYLLVNSKGREMLGASTDELLRLNIKDIIFSEELAGNSLGFDELPIGKTVLAECRLRSKNDRFMPVEVSIKRLDDGRLQAIVRDNTERKQAEEALRASEERFALAVRGSNDGIWDWDMVNHTLYWSPRLIELCGYDPDELDAGFDKFASRLHPDDEERVMAALEAHLKDRLPYDVEERLRCKSGEYRWFQARGQAIWDETGRPLRMVGATTDITERKQSEEALRQSEERFRQVVASIGDHIYMLEVTADGNPIYRYLSPNFEVLTGYPAEKFITDRNFWFSTLVYPEDRAIAMAQGARVISGKSEEIECRLVRADGRVIWVRNSVKVESAEAGLKKFYGVLSDITRSKELEEQLRQAQKMEAIGQLAGGVAHDFNNILTVIKGYTGLLLQDLDTHDPLSHDIGQIQKSAERAAALTRQLLAFSRRQLLQPVVLDLNGIVTNLDKMLHRLIREDIILTILLDPVLGWIKADPGQIEQVIINLVLNARDAMPQGGKLTIETKNIYLDKAYARQHIGVKTGPYIILAMSDTGSGMDEETRSHIFEPFFTTKEQGKGTGLGLATVHGIINQSGGHIWVYSELGQGTTFKIYLPQVEEAVYLAKPDPQSALPSKRGSETILLVEDEASVRELAHRALLKEGYIILEASNGEEALRVAQQHQGPIDLLVTDMVMPGGMSGRQLVERLIPLRQEMKVLYMSGYTDDAIVRHGILDAGMAFLQKPFTPNILASKIREVLNIP